MTSCYHCGDECYTIIKHKEKDFCCNGCVTVFDIFSDNNLENYYRLEKSPGSIPKISDTKFKFLSDEKIVNQLLSFNEDDTQIVTLSIPKIHCSSCIWILENLSKLESNIISSYVNFPKKTVQITYKSKEFNLKELVDLLCRIGYEPSISLNDLNKKTVKKDRSLIYKLGVAGFAFGNIMFLSFPEYFEHDEFWLNRFKPLFRWLIFSFSIPVVFYAAQDYLISAYKGLKLKHLNIDVPISLGILALFIRSSVDVIFNFGSGFFDSLAGLIFFLLLGKFFQKKTYSFLSFERDYKSYFPISVTKLNLKSKSEEIIQVNSILPNDLLLIRNQEIIPVDGILKSDFAEIDYSFVTGESKPIIKKKGEQIFAGGKQISGALEMNAQKKIDQSYLTQLWSNEAFNKESDYNFNNITNSISKYFTIAILSIAVLSSIYWLIFDTSKVLNVFTSVLIIACPCAIALASPFTLGNILRVFGKVKFYLKNSSVIENLSSITTIVFDKTGTITTSKQEHINYSGENLNVLDKSLIKSTIRYSNHPLSRMLYEHLKENPTVEIKGFKENIGLGIEAKFQNKSIKIGSLKFLNENSDSADETSVHIKIDDEYFGKFVFENNYRKGLTSIFNDLSKKYKLIILSGDNEKEKGNLEKLLPKNTQLHFNNSPEDKLKFIKNLQKENDKVLMIGDGLNDSGALAQSNVGISLSEDVNVFSPACDGILDASQFRNLSNFLKISNQSISIIKWSFIISFIYNFIGLSFAVSGNLSPLVAAILMPLSSITIVIFTTITSNLISKKLIKFKV